MIVVKISADRPGMITCDLNFSTPHQPTATYFSENDQLVMQGKVPGFALRRTFEQVEKAGDQHKYPEVYNKAGKLKPGAKNVLYDEEVYGLGMAFNARVKAINKGGSVNVSDTTVSVQDADEVVFILSAASSYNGFDKSPAYQGADPTGKVKQYLSAVEHTDYPALYQQHTEDYKSLFDRVKLTLGTPSDQSQRPTDTRVEQFANGKDPSLAALYFQFGRYLMIAGSRPGGQPLNLQGIWNNQVIPPLGRCLYHEHQRRDELLACRAHQPV